MQILLSDLAATQQFASCLAGCIDEAALIALEGPLGAGKTTLVKALGAKLGVVELITSPTFTMLNEYHSGRLGLFHLDIYRGGETGESIDLTMLAEELDELMAGGGVAVVEWPKYFICDGRSYFDGRDYLSLGLSYVQGDSLPKNARFSEVMSTDSSEEDEPTKSTRPIISQAVDNPGSISRVLREESPPEKYIKDGFTEARIATLSANGALSADLLAELSGKVSDMVINL